MNLDNLGKKGTSFLGTSLLIIVSAMVLLSGCSTPDTAPSGQVIPEEAEFTYSVSTTAAPIQISGGNLHWHKQLPDNTYTLENAALEIYNFGDFDILVTQLEMRVDETSKLFNVDVVIPAMTRESINIQPMIEDYDGNTHTSSVALLGENGEIIYQSSEYKIGPLEPIPGTGGWKQV